MRDEIKQMNKVIKKTDFYNIHDRQKFVIDQKQKFMMKTQAFAPQDTLDSNDANIISPSISSKLLKSNNLRSKNESPNIKYNNSQSSIYSESEEIGSPVKSNNSRAKNIRNIPSLKRMVTIGKNLANFQINSKAKIK